MNMIEIVKLMILALALGVCCYTDVKHRLIKNVVTFPLMLMGFVFNSIQFGFFDGMLFSLKGIGIMFLVCILMSVLGGFGFGDTKLLMGIASMCGWWFSFDVLLFALTSMILYFLLFKFKVIKQLVRNMKCIFQSLVCQKEIPILDKKDSAWTVPYACFISVGYAISLIYNVMIGGNFIWNILN